MFGCQISAGRLRRAGFVEELIICAAFVVPFTCDDCCMFFGSDRSLSLASNFGPCSFDEDGPREPAKINGQIVKLSQIMPVNQPSSPSDRSSKPPGQRVTRRRRL